MKYFLIGRSTSYALNPILQLGECTDGIYNFVSDGTLNSIITLGVKWSLFSDSNTHLLALGIFIYHDTVDR